MTYDTSGYDIGKIRDLLTKAFTPESLRRFCMDRPLFRPIVAQFGPGHGLDDMVDRVIDYCRTQILWDELLAAVQEANPRQYARFEPCLSTSKPTQGNRPPTSSPASTPIGPDSRALPAWIWLVGLLLLFLILVVGISLLVQGGPTPERIPSGAALATEAAFSSPGLYDGFDDPTFNGSWNPRLWEEFSDSDGAVLVSQQDGILTITRHSAEAGGLRSESPWTLEDIGSVEARVMLDDEIEASMGMISIGIRGSGWWLSCSIVGGQDIDAPYAWCDTSDSKEGGGEAPAQYDSWHTLRFETNPDTADIAYFLDGRPHGDDSLPDTDAFRQNEFYVTLQVWSEDGSLVKGYADEVWIGNGQ